jgi:hypothetical protein
MKDNKNDNFTEQKNHEFCFQTLFAFIPSGILVMASQSWRKIKHDFYHSILPMYYAKQIGLNAIICFWHFGGITYCHSGS